jgi:hypothetical protein
MVIGYPMVLALGFVALVANVSAMERFWAIAEAIRIREKDRPEARTSAQEKVFRETRTIVKPASTRPTSGSGGLLP